MNYFTIRTSLRSIVIATATIRTTRLIAGVFEGIPRLGWFFGGHPIDWLFRATQSGCDSWCESFYELKNEKASLSTFFVSQNISELATDQPTKIPVRQRHGGGS
jgi:hypothetical protein